MKKHKKKGLFELLRLKTNYQEYVETMTDLSSQYSLNRADLSIEFALKYLGDNNDQLTDKDIDLILKKIETIHLIDLTDIEVETKRQVTQLYTYQKKKVLPVETDDKNIKKKYQRSKDGGLNASYYSLEDYDRNAIDKISDGAIIWFKDHASDSDVSQDIEEVLISSRMNNFTADQTVAVLRTYFDQYTPASYKKRYAEASYWKGFNLNQATLTRNNADLSRFDSAGIKKYRIYARRTERTCARCRGFHGQIYSVKDGLSKMNTYFDAVESNDLKAMKKVTGWGNGKVAPSQSELGKAGTLPPFHFHCQCYIEYITKQMISDLNTRFSMIKDPTIRKTANKAWNDDADLTIIIDTVKDDLKYEISDIDDDDALYDRAERAIKFRTKEVARDTRVFRHEFGHAISSKFNIKTRLRSKYERYRAGFVEQFDIKEVGREEYLANVSLWNNYLAKQYKNNVGLHDMISGATFNGLKLRWTHPTSYWKRTNLNGQSDYTNFEEFIANYIEMKGNLNPTDLEQAREVFPDICEMLDEELSKIARQLLDEDEI